jgi:hypothetical protein
MVERIVTDVMSSLLGTPPSATPRCPDWPPDLFAVVAEFLARSGEYTAVVESNRGLPRDWVRTSRDAGREWRAQIDGTSWESWLEPQLPEVAPKVVQGWWAEFCAWRDLKGPRTPATALKLLSIADEASAGIGFSQFAGTTFAAVWEFASSASHGRTMCLSVAEHAARVLPKQHTAQRGLTLRSLTHHLALLPHSEVHALWQRPRQASDALRGERLNILCLPWPLELDRRSFKVTSPPTLGVSTMDLERHRFFELNRSADIATLQAFSAYVASAVSGARKWCDSIDLVLLPELALDLRLLTRFQEAMQRLKAVGIAGVAVRDGETLGAHAGPRNLAAVVGVDDDQLLLQSKHHRWCLETSQIRQYGLSGLLPNSIDLWEGISLGRREARFVTISSWLTFTTLICEDLARQDPMAATIRAVGSNLVFALLMDGPQLRHRWGPRYATALAEDPGSSVCILTSLGLTQLSTPRETGVASRSRVVGLWKDVQRDVELELGPDETALVLHIDREGRTEFTADGRSSEAGFFPVLRDFNGLRAGPG